MARGTSRPGGAIRALDLSNLEDYLVQCAASDAESGRGGDSYSGPYSSDEPYPVALVRERNRERWVRPLDEPSWRRAWGAFVGNRMVGSASLIGGDLAADLHRVDLGMGVLRDYRRQGFGQLLLATIIDWCRARPTIDWIDLGVFADNEPAKALYVKLGFEVVGSTRDRWRVDGTRIDEIHMVLPVGSLG